MYVYYQSLFVCIKELVVVGFHWLETEPIRLTTTFGIVMCCISSIVAMLLFNQIVYIELALKYFCFQPLISCKNLHFQPFLCNISRFGP